MLHVSALFVARSAAFDEHGAINATSIPMAWFQVDQMPLWARVPVVLVVHAQAGGDYDPELHVVCKDPAGGVRGSLRASWNWPDDGDRPSKYRCFTQELKFPIETEGEYTIGAYYDADGKFELATPVPMSIQLSEAARAEAAQAEAAEGEAAQGEAAQGEAAQGEAAQAEAAQAEAAPQAEAGPTDEGAGWAQAAPMSVENSESTENAE